MSTPESQEDESFDDLLLVIVDKLEKQEFDLPPLPHIASQVLAVTTNPDADSSRLTALIQHDPILAAKIFQTANSAAFGTSRKIDSLSQAVAWLGLNTVATTAFMQSVQSGVFEVGGYELEVKQLWTHAWATGLYAKTIAGVTGNSPDSAFLCGLLHSIGKPFVVHTVNQHQKNCAVRLPWTTILTLIQESHVEVGRQLAEAWELPAPVKEAITLHEDQAFHLGTSSTNAATITNLAQHLANYCIDPQTISKDTLRRLPVLQRLTLPKDVIDMFLDIQEAILTQVEAMIT